MHTPNSLKLARWLAAAVAASLPFHVGCPADQGAGSNNVSTPGTNTGHELTRFLPADTRGALLLDINQLRTEGTDAVLGLFDGQGADAALVAPFATVTAHALGLDVAEVMAVALLAQTTDPQDGFILLGQLKGSQFLDLVDPGDISEQTPYKEISIYSQASSGLHAALLPEGLLVVGRGEAVRSVVDVHVGDAGNAQQDTHLGPYLQLLQGRSAAEFVYGLPALYSKSARALPASLSLAGAEVVSGHLEFAGELFSGQVSFHAANAAEFVTAYNERKQGGTDALLTLGDPAQSALPSTVDVVVESTPLDRSATEIMESRHTLKHLFHNMNALEYAQGVRHGDNPPWMSFAVEGSPNSIFINFEMDPSQLEAFEQNELPQGFKLKPLRILESDEPGYFLVLNVYHSGGGLVSGARAEWSVFVEDPINGHARFLVIQAAAAIVSADSVNLLTMPEPVTHEQVGNTLATYVGVEVGDPPVEQDYFRSAIVWPQERGTLVGFAREFVAANDYIFWGNGVADRGLYNGTVHNRDALLIPSADIQVNDDSRWSSYVRSTPKHSFVYLTPLEIVVSPWWNLEADYLDVTPTHLQDLITFKDGFYPDTIVDQATTALAENKNALANVTVPNETPTTFFNYQITDVEAFATSLDLPPGHSLAPTTIVDGDATAEYYLTLRVRQNATALAGLRADWCIYTDDGSGRPHLMIIASATADAALDPVTLLALPTALQHQLSNGILNTTIRAPSFTFEASLNLNDAVEALPSLDWVETEDYVCWLNGICDKQFYDGTTLEAPLSLVEPSTVPQIETPWDGLIAAEPASTFLRRGSQVYVLFPWQNVP
jgi:hypothetical protein